jgi:hypothetical protein
MENLIASGWCAKSGASQHWQAPFGTHLFYRAAIRPMVNCYEVHSIACLPASLSSAQLQSGWREPRGAEERVNPSFISIVSVFVTFNRIKCYISRERHPLAEYNTHTQSTLHRTAPNTRLTTGKFLTNFKRPQHTRHKSFIFGYEQRHAQ